MLWRKLAETVTAEVEGEEEVLAEDLADKCAASPGEEDVEPMEDTTTAEGPCGIATEDRLVPVAGA